MCWIISSVPDREKYPEFYFSKFRDSMHMMLEPLGFALENCDAIGRLARIVAGRHINLPQGTPLANLWLTQARRLGVPLPRFADSTGTVAALFA